MRCVTLAISKCSSQYLFSPARIRVAVYAIANRSYSAPYFSIEKTLSLCLALAWFLTMIASSVLAQTRPSDRTAMDVIVLVIPVSPNNSRIAIAYKHRVPHDTVVQDIKVLAVAQKGLASDTEINDESVHPDRPKEFPVNTAASFSMSGCNQVVRNAPDLTPYIKTFQRWTHVEVVFAVPTIAGYSGVVRFEDPALAVTLIKELDAYRYEVEIRDHKKDLPAFPENQIGASDHEVAVANPEAGRAAHAVVGRAEGLSVTTLGAWLFAAIVFAFMAMYLLRLRRNAVSISRPGRTNV